VITLTYLDLPLLEFSLERFYATSSLYQKEHILIDHHWPLDYWNHRHGVLRLAEKYGCKVMSPYRNLGGHGGYNWAIKNLPIDPHDIVITYDGDSNPVSYGWDFALVSLLTHDPAYAAASLFIDAELSTQDWMRYTTRAGLDVMKPKVGIEMINVTAWRAQFIQQVQGIQGEHRFYGQIEAPMFELMKTHQKLHGYLADYKEVPRPFQPDARYQAWKDAHVRDYFRGNFDEWLRQGRGNL
jgi:hypothetical protein